MRPFLRAYPPPILPQVEKSLAIRIPGFQKKKKSFIAIILLRRLEQQLFLLSPHCLPGRPFVNLRRSGSLFSSSEQVSTNACIETACRARLHHHSAPGSARVWRPQGLQKSKFYLFKFWQCFLCIALEWSTSSLPSSIRGITTDATGQTVALQAVPGAETSSRKLVPWANCSSSASSCETW